MNIVINACYGGFSLSDEAVLLYAKKKGITLYVDNSGYLTHFFTVPVEQYRELQADVKANDKDYKRLNESGWYFSDRAIPRDDPALVEVVKELGKKANGRSAKLKVVRIPANVEWEIAEYDGLEHVAEKHRTWR